jgi:hypothetical protein
LANVKHSGLTGTDLHEPKGVASAGLGQSYISDNAGSGGWKQIATDADATETTMEPKGITAASEFQVYQRGATAAGSWVCPATLHERTYITLYPTTGSQTFVVGAGEVDTKIVFTQNYSEDSSSSNIAWDNTDKVVEFTGEQSVVVQIGISFSLALTTGTNVTLRIDLERSTDGGSNWTALNGATMSRKFPGSDVGNMGFSTVTTLDTDDQFRLVRYVDTASTFTTTNVNISLLGVS